LQTSSPISPISSQPIQTSIFQPNHTPDLVASTMSLPGTVNFSNSATNAVAAPAVLAPGQMSYAAPAPIADNTFFLILIVVVVGIVWAAS
jgi:hypothetical protein